MHRLLHLVAGFLLAATLAMPSAGADINWSSSVNGVNQTSAGTGSPMGADFTFELGAFDNGFTPTAANVASWAANWVALDRDAYNATNKLFASKATLASNAAPFARNQLAYIWGFDKDNPGEWILITNPDWFWPRAEDGIQFPETWTLGNAGTTTVVGEVNGSGFQMRSAAVAAGPPSVNPDAWLQQYFTTSERNTPAISGWDADTDADGANTMLEFAAGTNPRTGASRPSLGIEFVGGAEPGVIVRLERCLRADITHTAESSTDLAGWSPAGFTLLTDTESEIVFKFTGTDVRRFFRLTFSL